MSDDERMADVLEDQDRASLRGTLMQLATQSLRRTGPRPDSGIMGPYGHEAAIWIHSGMPTQDAIRAVRNRMGIESHTVEDGGRVLLFPVTRSNEYRAMKMHVQQGCVDSIEFIKI